MKKLFLLAAIFAVVSCGPKTYKVEGTIIGDAPELTNGTIILSNTDRENPLRDTIDIVEGSFSFEKEVKHPEVYTIVVGGLENRGMIVFFLEPSDITIEADLSNLLKANVVGGENNAIKAKYNAATVELEEEYDIQGLMAKYSDPATSQEERDALIVKYEEFSAKIASIEDEVVAESPLSLYALNKFAGEYISMDYAEAKEKFDAFAKVKSFKNIPIFKMIKENLAAMETLQPGNIAPEIVLNDPNGNEITLSSIYSKNKVTMIDFWASWCGPCRAFNPELKKIYEEYKEKGFEIYGVSFDRDHASWIKGIEEDALPWPQVSDLMFWQTPIQKLYQVNFIPQNVFVDQDGKIIERLVEKDKIRELLDANL